MKRIGQITYELSEQEHNQLKNLANDILDYFNHYNDRKDAEFSINKIIEILDGNS